MNHELSSTFKLLTVWLLLGLLVFLGFQWHERRTHQSQFRVGEGVIELHRANDGHYHWPGRINGHAVDFLVDTGATSTAIPSALMDALELKPVGVVQSSTAGGMVQGRLVRVDVTLNGGVSADQLQVVALPQLDDSPLLGMDVLGRLHWQQHTGVLRIDLSDPH